MIYSMTGYGKAVTIIGKFVFEIEIKSLNNRFLELSMKLPQILQPKEYELREILRQKIKRGKIYFSINARIENGGQNSLAVDEGKVVELLKSIDHIQAKYNIGGKIEISDLLQVKDIFALSIEEFSEQDFEQLKKCLVESIDSLLSMKQSEGAELVKDIQGRISSITKLIDEIEVTQKASLTEHFEKIKLRVAELINGASINAERLELELALLSDKSDITEECVRTRSHLKFFEETIAQGDDIGRKLNFLCQELHREANTISSKSISSTITRGSVLLREEVERIREQVQNIE